MTTTPDAGTARPTGSLVLAFDFGRARTGVAVGETLTGSIRPLLTLPCHNGEPDWQQLDRIMAEWRPRQLVVGLPLALDGSATPTTRASRRFAQTLEQRYALPVSLHDERLSSREAEQRFTQARRHGQARRRQRQHLDAMAACVILESWLAEDPPGCTPARNIRPPDPD